ncbi:MULTISPECIES: mechanosensitive ion channel family protein [Microbacterium]|uniref:Mechanosensitive ion channel family protein n=1 Tax=Microbacterium aurugineum TaxID=2851642 RepID=A0ABY4J2N2_9MICO|nr:MULTISPECIES: mechanosensitive ion channel domain-containing protein [Microbacterium]UPL18058.1 mechanosensitive ion channel family protein [Microbacterium aurugineum]
MTLEDLFPDGLSALQIGLAVLSVLVGWLLSRFARKGVLKLTTRTPGISDSVAQLAARFTQYALLLVGIGVGLAFLGANVQPLLAMTAIAVVVLILVLRGVADNFAAGVLIQSRQSVKIGEEIAIDGPDGEIRGKVQELNGRAVILTTVDGRTVHVPNAALLTGVLVNNSRHGARRSALEVRIARSDDLDLDEVIGIITDAAATVDGVHTRERPGVRISSVSPTRWMLELQVWHHPLHGATVVSDTVRAVAEALEAAGLRSVVAPEQSTPPLVPPEPY